MAQDTTNFTKVQCDEIIVPVVKASEINGRTDTITVIANVGTGKDYTLTAAQKKARLVEVTAASNKNLILGLEPGQWMVVKNNDANTALLVKNKAADTALSIAANKAALVIAGTGGSIISILTA